MNNQVVVLFFLVSSVACFQCTSTSSCTTYIWNNGAKNGFLFNTNMGSASSYTGTTSGITYLKVQLPLDYRSSNGQMTISLPNNNNMVFNNFDKISFLIYGETNYASTFSNLMIKAGAGSPVNVRNSAPGDIVINNGNQRVEISLSSLGWPQAGVNSLTFSVSGTYDRTFYLADFMVVGTVPTSAPTMPPTFAPTLPPTSAATRNPTSAPTSAPTKNPTTVSPSLGTNAQPHTNSTEFGASEEVKVGSSAGKSASPIVGIIGGVIGGVVLLCVIAILVILIIMRRRKQQNPGNHVNLEKPSTGSISVGVEIKNVTILEVLGSGNFGSVYKGVWKGRNVALKQLKQREEDFFREASMLERLNHPNIVAYLGIHTSATGEKYMVMEHLPLGSLKNLMAKQPDVNTGDLIAMARQAAEGMAYLSECRIVHRDLAMRNLLVGLIDGHYIVKISDFGLSRSIESSYYASSTDIPVRWSAPEVLEFGVCTTKSDVYSFGIVLWEIFSLGKTPWSELTNDDTRKVILQGQQLPIPHNCPQDVYNLMKWCWAKDGNNRPTFNQIVEKIKAMENGSSSIIASPMFMKQQKPSGSINNPIYVKNIPNISPDAHLYYNN